MAFILDKIPGSQTNAPELFLDIPCGKSAATTYRAGTVVCVKDGVLEFTGMSDPGEYVVFSEKTTSSETDTVRCFKILPGMIFKANSLKTVLFKVGYRGVITNTSGVSKFNSSSSNPNEKGPIIVDMNGSENAAPGSMPVIYVMFDRV